jgi:hypothetical protein
MLEIFPTLPWFFMYLGFTNYRQWQDEPVLVITRHLVYVHELDLQPLETDFQGHNEVEDEDEVSLDYVM